MKSYLDLIPISAKVRKKQTRMIRLCIVLSVFLVASIFSMVDMDIQSMKRQTILSDGAWHAAFKGIDGEQMTLIWARPEVVESSRYGVENYHLDMNYQVNGTQTAVCGADAAFLDLYPAFEITEGSFPEGNEEALVTENMRKQLSLAVGQSFELETPEGKRTFRVSGFVRDTATLLQGGAYGLFLNMEAYMAWFQKDMAEADVVFYVQFTPFCRIQDTIEDICQSMGISEDQVGQNVELLGLMLQSEDTYILKLYYTAFLLAVLVAAAGILMIVGSLNSNVAQRTEFFGMMRCLGATEKQVRRFVRVEALSWCRTAIPLGLAGSMMIVWLLCGMLRAISPTYFGEMPVFAVSWGGLAAGFVIGLFTVLAAAHTPAKKASKVSPLAAVTGNADTIFAVKRAADTRFLRVETALGIHHATGSKKNMILLAGSFALSILLFLSFSTGVDFMRHALVPMRADTPDVSVVSPDNSCSVPDALFQELKGKTEIKRIFGRSFAYDLPAVIHGEDWRVNLISYEENQFQWAEKDLTAGDMEKVKNGQGVLMVTHPKVTADAGEWIELQTELGIQKVCVEGVLSYAPFNRDENTGTIICSEALFRELTGEKGYTIIDIQLQDPSDSVVAEIREMAADGFVFSDRRERNSEIRGTYYSFAIFVYGFLAIIALIAVFNIINSIGMSVSARLRQYGVMRAIGIRIGQLQTMVAAEAASYIVIGVVIGLFTGLPLHYFLYQQLITSRWGTPWNFPVPEMGIIMAVLVISTVIAVMGPVKRIREMSIVDTISAQ